MLGGLSPAQNRQVPPLRHGLVRQLASDFPGVRFSLNGGIETLASARAALPASALGGGAGMPAPAVAPPGELAGVMVGVCGFSSGALVSG